MLPTLSSSQLDLLTHNSQHIFAAASTPHEKPLELVPSLIGNYLYCPTSGLKGRILRIFHRCWTKLFGKGLTNRKLAKAVQATQKCFAQLEISRRAHHDIIYQDYLDNRFDNRVSKYALKEIELARNQIKQFYSSTYPLSRLVRRKSNEKLNAFLQTHFAASIAKKNPPFYAQATFKKIKGFVRMMALEGMVGEELPLHVFRENSQIEPDEIKKTEIKALQTFVQRIAKAKKQGRFSIELFHSALKSIVRLLAKQNEERSLEELEELLIKEGCIFLNEFDQEHVEWRDHLSPDASFRENEPFYFLDAHEERHEFTLGPRVDSVSKKHDYCHIYEIHIDESKESDTKHLLLIPPNKICLEFMELMRLKSFWGLETPAVSYIHPSGKYAVVEKLPLSLSDIEWKSDLLGDLCEEDKKYAAPLRVLIQFFIDEKNSPKKLRAEYLKFDKKGALKTTKDCIPCGKIDYLALEELAYAAVQEMNLAVYRHLVEPILKKSGCKKHLNKFFRDCISSAFKNNPYPIKVLAEIRRVDDKKVILRGIKLAVLAKKMKKECLEELCKRYLHVDKKKLRKQMGKSLLALYDRDKTLGRFWKSMDAEDLIEETEKHLDTWIA
jgi:hypothetical protein